jgi:predicted dehydrogenase
MADTRNKNLTIGLVGLGNWAKSIYLPILLRREDVDIVAVSARTSETLNSAKSLINNEVELYADYRDLLIKSNIDAVFIGLPKDVTATATIDAVHAGKHVFVEPPLFLGKRFSLLENLVSSSGKSFHVDVELNYLPMIERCKEILQNNNLGELITSKIELGVDWGSTFETNKYTIMENVIGLSSWYISLFDMFNCSPVKSAIYTSLNQKPPDIGSIKVEYQNGFQGEWQFNLRDFPSPNLHCELILTNGTIKCDLLKGLLEYQVQDGNIIKETHEEQNLDPTIADSIGFAGMQESVNEFIDSIYSKRRVGLFDLQKYTNVKDIHSMLYSYCSLEEPS